MNIGIVGLGHLGKIHLKLLHEIPEFKISAIYDIDQTITHELAAKYQVLAANSYAQCLDEVDAVCIVTPTPTHFDLAEKAIRNGKHVFIEKPSTTTLDETKKLINLSREAGVTVQVGHVERFNPAFLAAREYITKPVFFEVHRMAQYNKRGTDVSVVLDLMIHDIDLILSVTKSKVKKIAANGAAVVSASADMASARIEFENGAVANISANRLALSNLRKFRVFQSANYINIDLLNKTVSVSSVNPYSSGKGMVIDTESARGKFEISHFQPITHPINAIKTELEYFYKSITQNHPVAASLKDAEDALAIALEIENLIA